MRNGRLPQGTVFLALLVMQGGCIDPSAMGARAHVRHERNSMEAASLEQAAELGRDDQLLRIFMAPSSWAPAVSRLEGHNVERRDIAAVGCVGEVQTEMFCSWQRRRERRWRKYSGRADLSGENPHLSSQSADAPDDR
jgi:hypothetical protein